MHRLSAYVIVHRTQTNQTPNANQSDTERNPIRHRTQSNQTADGIRSDGERNLIKWRTQTVGGAAVSAAPTKQTEQEQHQQSLQISFHEPQPDPRPARYHAPRSHEQPIAPVDGHYLLATLHRIHDVRSHMLR